jgi:pyruvate/2-oxoglutarate dehydrogenase complex dihydrolipoamide dehydrogenase (E3) component
LLRSAKLLAQARDSQSLGIRAMHVEFDFADVMARVSQAIHQIEPHDSLERYRGLGVDVIEGEARLRSPWEVEVTTPEGTRTLSARHIVIAAGARPAVPSIPGIEGTGFLTSDTVWSLRTLPRRLLVIGAGPIGCEMALAFARFGSQVTLLDQASRLLNREDPDVSALVSQCFAKEGITLRLSTRAIRFECDGLGADAVNSLVAEHDGRMDLIEFDQVLCALGRVANTGGYGLEALDVRLTPRGTVQVDPFLRTNYPSILAAGDVAGRYQFTHAAANMAWYAAVNALFGGLWQFRIDERVMPWCTFLDPEVARVGLNEQDASEQGIAVEVTRYSLDDLDRAIVDGATRGFVKVLTRPGTDRILGATIVGEHAGELIVEFVTAMKRGLGLNKLLGTIHIYPTFAEANKYAAGQWKRAHAPTRLLGWVERFHRWQRG